MHELLRPSGTLVLDIFPIGDHTTGPPYAMSAKLVEDLLTPLGFTCTLLREPGEKARPKTTAGELIAVWKRSSQ
eukprot:m.106336 g.106336  ORF g.106336 m.106336 type:complete len:74 (-) comp16894_c0_seq12:145-366(-)